MHQRCSSPPLFRCRQEVKLKDHHADPNAEPVRLLIGDLQRLDVIQSAHYFANVPRHVASVASAGGTIRSASSDSSAKLDNSISPYIFCYIQFTNVKEIPVQAHDILIVIFNPHFLVSNALTPAGMFF